MSTVPDVWINGWTESETGAGCLSVPTSRSQKATVSATGCVVISVVARMDLGVLRMKEVWFVFFVGSRTSVLLKMSSMYQTFFGRGGGARLPGFLLLRHQ